MFRKLATLFLLLFTTHNVTAETLKLGALLDLTKVYAPQGQAFLRGIELAVEEINQAEPNSIEYFVEDTEFDVKKAVVAAQTLIIQKKVNAVLTMSATEQKSVLPIAKKSKVLTVALWDSSPDIEALGEFSFGFGPWTPATGEASAQFSYLKLGARNAYIVVQQDEWSELAGSFFKDAFERLGGKISEFDKLVPSSTDFRSTITKIRNSKSDLIFCPLAVNIAQFLKQARQQSLTQKIVTADVLTDEEINNSLGGAEGVYHLESDSPETLQAQDLYRRYKLRYGKESELKQFLSWGNDAVKILMEGWKRANQRPGAEFATGVRSISNLELTAGIISITEKGSAPKYPVPHQVKNGKLIWVQN